MEIPNWKFAVREFIFSYCKPYPGFLMSTTLSDESYAYGKPVDTVLGVSFTTSECYFSEVHLAQWSESQNKLIPYSEA